MVYVKGLPEEVKVFAEEWKTNGDMTEFRVKGVAVASFSRSELIGFVEMNAFDPYAG